MSKEKSYYKETLPEIIEQLKGMVENNLEIVAKNFAHDLREQELKSALESRKVAVESIVWASKEIGRMQYELNDVDEEIETSYFMRIIPRLIKELKGMVENNLSIVGFEIEESLEDSKMKSALQGRLIAAEHAVWASRQVDELEKTLNGDSKTEEDSCKSPIQNWTKRKANKAV